MNDDLLTTTKQVGLEIINIGDILAQELLSWGEVLDQNPSNVVATYSAGFTSKTSSSSGFEMVIDVQTPPNEKPMLHTWAIEARMDNNQHLLLNSLQLTFEPEEQRTRALIAKGKTITRDDIRLLLQESTTQLASINIVSELTGDGVSQTYIPRYELTAAQLTQFPAAAAQANQAIQAVLQAIRQSLASRQSGQNQPQATPTQQPAQI